MAAFSDNGRTTEAVKHTEMGQPSNRMSTDSSVKKEPQLMLLKVVKQEKQRTL